MSVIRNIILLFAMGTLLSACAAPYAAPQMPPRESIVPGETITIEGNPNVYTVARAHNVSMREIIVLNNLQPPFTLHPGQRLILPMPSSSSPSIASGAGSWGPPAAAPSGTIMPAPLGAMHPAPPTSSNSSVTPVTSEPIEVLNAPTPPPKAVPTTMSATMPSSSQQTAMLAPLPIPENKPAPADEDALGAPAFVWPLQGPIMSSFGPKGQGLSNDGVNIGAPKGAPVVAAGGGIVVYAGNEMKGFGNLILIRHEGGWVTAYAHLDRILVAKDAIVAKGDMIGTVGKTGNVPSTQLHFEVRHESKPLDPTSVIKAD